MSTTAQRYVPDEVKSLVSVLTTLALAGAVLPNDNMATQTVNGVEIWWGLDSHERDAKASGTNVNCNFRVYWAAEAQPPVPAYDSAEILELSVKCVESPDLNKTYYPVPPISPTLAKMIRIASTHFQDWTDIAPSWISFEVKAKVRLFDNEGVLPTVDYQTPTHVARLKPWNKGMTFEIGEFAELFGNTSGAHSALINLELMKHTVTDDRRDGDWAHMHFVNALSRVTAMHTGAHGSSYGIQDNFGTWITSGDVESARLAGQLNGFPPLNVAFIDACYIGQNTTWLRGLLYPFPPTFINQAAVGFKVILNEQCSPALGNGFWDSLNSKRTFGKAVDLAVKAYNTENDEPITGIADIQPGDVNKVGDVMTRLNGVYTDTTTQSPTDWYLEIG